jgi:predicted ArsR family transcriptional regulator
MTNAGRTLFDAPRARIDDAHTSHAAAASMVGAAGEHRRLILDALRAAPTPLSAEEIAGRVGLTGVQVARRLAELRRAGAIAAGERVAVTRSGRAARTWTHA